MLNDFLNRFLNNKETPAKKQTAPKRRKSNGKKGISASSASPTMTSWDINGQSIPVEVHRERRNNVRVSFGKNKLILRTSSLINAQEEATAIAQLKTAIEKQIVKKPELFNRFSSKSYANHDTIKVGDKTYFLHIELEERKSHTGKLGKNGIIQLRLASADTEGGRQKVIPTLLSRIISQDCSPLFSRRVLELNHQFFQKDIKSINFKYNHSNWGSCSSTGNLNFSTRLLFAPEDVQDYVIIHELAHLIELNHSDRFWALVKNAMPNYTEKELWLKQHGHECYF